MQSLFRRDYQRACLSERMFIRENVYQRECRKRKKGKTEKGKRKKGKRKKGKTEKRKTEQSVCIFIVFSPYRLNVTRRNFHRLVVKCVYWFKESDHNRSFADSDTVVDLTFAMYTDTMYKVHIIPVRVGTQCFPSVCGKNTRCQCRTLIDSNLYLKLTLPLALINRDYI